MAEANFNLGDSPVYLDEMEPHGNDDNLRGLDAANVGKSINDFLEENSIMVKQRRIRQRQSTYSMM